MDEMPNKSAFAAKFSKRNIQAEKLDDEITDEYIKNLSVIELVQGVLDNGKPCYAYALIPEKKYKSFKYAEMAGNYNLADYGEVLHHGDGLFPPQNIIDMMQQKYGADYNFIEKLEEQNQQIVEMYEAALDDDNSV